MKLNPMHELKIFQGSFCSDDERDSGLFNSKLIIKNFLK